MLNNNKLTTSINLFWDKEILPVLQKYIKIPNKSPSFDKNWKANGHMDKVLSLAKKWSEKHLPSNANLIIKEEPGRTPLLLIDISGAKPGNILMYGHLDKQPEMEGWDEGLGPWSPVLKDDKLYGRGGADDGYALFASLCAVKSLIEQKIETPRILILIEFSEESGSPDLPFYIKECEDLIQTPDLVICLDSGAGDYKRLWTTSSLRGLIGCSLRVDVLNEGVHSGGASGHVPSSFRIIRKILSRIEDEDTGYIKIDNLHAEIPHYRIEETKKLVEILGDEVIKEFPWFKKMGPSTNNLVEGVLRRTWRPTLSVVGASGLPPTNNAGNVLRPYTTLRLSVRIPPLVDHLQAQEALRKTLEENPPYGAAVKVKFEEPASGWDAPETKNWLKKSILRASLSFFGEESCSMSEGGTIPFMAMLGNRFPKAQFLITGVLGPGSNAHGPNEFLHISYAKKLTSCIATVLADFKK